MDSLAGLYHITPENLSLRRRFIGLDADVIALLGSLRPWAAEVADDVAAELTEHAFAFPAAAEFFDAYVARKGISLSRAAQGLARRPGRPLARDLRRAGQGTAVRHRLLRGACCGSARSTTRSICRSSGSWGPTPAYLDAVRHALRDTPPQIARAEAKASGWRRRREPEADLAVLADAERAIRIVFNYDQQAITDAFYFDTFATLGVNLGEIAERLGHARPV